MKDINDYTKEELYDKCKTLEELIEGLVEPYNKITNEQRNDELLTIQNKMVREVAEQEKQNKLK